MVACPCHAFSWLFMKIIRCDCGHIKARWDNQKNCLSSSFVPACRLVPPVVFGQRRSWFLQISNALILQEDQSSERRNRTRRDWLSTQMHLKTTLDGSTTPQGYTAGGKIHQGGDYMDADCILSISPPVTVNQAPVNQSPISPSPISHAPGSLSPVNQAPVNQSLVTDHRSFISDYQAPVTRHRAFNHQAPVTGQLVTGQQSTYQAPVIMHHSIGNEYWVANQSHKVLSSHYLMSLRTLQLQREFYYL